MLLSGEWDAIEVGALCAVGGSSGTRIDMLRLSLLCRQRRRQAFQETQRRLEEERRARQAAEEAARAEMAREQSETGVHGWRGRAAISTNIPPTLTAAVPSSLSSSPTAGRGR
jgi:hypothetical protein